MDPEYLDEIERVAQSANESFGSEIPDWYNGGWSEPSVSPDEVLALVARIRELEAVAPTGEAMSVGSKAWPVDVRMDGIQPGGSPSVRVTYQCESLEQALRQIAETMAIHSGCDVRWNPQTMELVLVFR